jgi:tetratricopeptide (TPR) repeat protein
VLNDKQKTKELEESRKRALTAETEVARLRKELENSKNRNNQALRDAYEYQTGILAANDYITRGNIALSNGWKEEALAEYNKAYEQMPKNDATYLFMGDVYSKADCKLSISCYEKYLEKNPSDIEVLIRVNKCSISKSYYEKAEQYYKNIVMNDPNNAGAYIKLASVSGKAGKSSYDDIARYIKKAIEIDPNYINAYHEVGNIYYNLEKYWTAKYLYERAIEIDPNNADLYCNIGLTYYMDLINFIREYGEYHEGYMDSMREYFLKAITINPKKYAHLYKEIGYIYATGGYSIVRKETWKKYKDYERIANKCYKECIKYYKKAARSGDENAKEWLRVNKEWFRERGYKY